MWEYQSLKIFTCSISSLILSLSLAIDRKIQETKVQKLEEAWCTYHHFQIFQKHLWTQYLMISCLCFWMICCCACCYLGQKMSSFLLRRNRMRYCCYRLVAVVVLVVVLMAVGNESKNCLNIVVYDCCSFVVGAIWFVSVSGFRRCLFGRSCDLMLGHIPSNIICCEKCKDLE